MPLRSHDHTKRRRFRIHFILGLMLLRLTLVLLLLLMLVKAFFCAVIIKATGDCAWATLASEAARISRAERFTRFFLPLKVILGPLLFYRNATARPVRIDSRAASSISVTIILFSSELSPEGFSLPRATAVK